MTNYELQIKKYKKDFGTEGYRPGGDNDVERMLSFVIRNS